MITTVVAASEAPVTMEKTKEHLRVTHATDDSYINALITAVTNFTENWLGRRFVTQTLKYYIHDFPRYCRHFEIPVAPIQSITHIKYYDENNVQQNYTTYQSDLIHTPPTIYLGDSEFVFPTTRKDKPNTVEVQFVAGYGASSAVPAHFKQGLMMAIAHFYENRQDVFIGNMQAQEMPKASEHILRPYKLDNV